MTRQGVGRWLELGVAVPSTQLQAWLCVTPWKFASCFHFHGRQSSFPPLPGLSTLGALHL